VQLHANGLHTPKGANMAESKSVDSAGKIKPGEFAGQKVRVDSVELTPPKARETVKGKRQKTIQLKKAR